MRSFTAGALHSVGPKHTPKCDEDALLNWGPGVRSPLQFSVLPATGRQAIPELSVPAYTQQENVLLFPDFTASQMVIIYLKPFWYFIKRTKGR